MSSDVDIQASRTLLHNLKSSSTDPSLFSFQLTRNLRRTIYPDPPVPALRRRKTLHRPSIQVSHNTSPTSRAPKQQGPDPTVASTSSVPNSATLPPFHRSASSTSVSVLSEPRGAPPPATPPDGVRQVGSFDKEAEGPARASEGALGLRAGVARSPVESFSTRYVQHSKDSTVVPPREPAEVVRPDPTASDNLRQAETVKLTHKDNKDIQNGDTEMASVAILSPSDVGESWDPHQFRTPTSWTFIVDDSGQQKAQMPQTREIYLHPSQIFSPPMSSDLPPGFLNVTSTKPALSNNATLAGEAKEVATASSPDSQKLLAIALPPILTLDEMQDKDERVPARSGKSPMNVQSLEAALSQPMPGIGPAYESAAWEHGQAQVEHYGEIPEGYHTSAYYAHYPEAAPSAGYPVSAHRYNAGPSGHSSGPFTYNVDRPGAYAPEGTPMSSPPTSSSGAHIGSQSRPGSMEGVNSDRSHSPAGLPQASVPPKRAGKLPMHVTNILKTWLMAHTTHPYPTEEEKRGLCVQTGLTMMQVSNWFINARRRILPSLGPIATTGNRKHVMPGPPPRHAMHMPPPHPAYAYYGHPEPAHAPRFRSHPYLAYRQVAEGPHHHQPPAGPGHYAHIPGRADSMYSNPPIPHH